MDDSFPSLANNPVPSDFSYKVSLNVTRSVRTVTFSQYFFFNVTLRLPKNYLLTKVSKRERERGRKGGVRERMLIIIIIIILFIGH